MSFDGRPETVSSSGLAETRVYGGGFAPGTDLRDFVLKERIPRLPGARCRGHSELFDEPPADDPYGDAVTERALAVCASCPALGPCEEWLRRLEPRERPRGVVAGRIIKSRGVITKDRQMKVSYYHASQ
jgi:WhiB family transcriptional regulator, redox-sensing transcriptional regulator